MAGSASTVAVSALILVTMSGGVFAGRKIPYHETTSNPGTPDSADGRHLRCDFRSSGAGVAKHAHLPSLGVFERGAAGEQEMDATRNEIVHRRPGAAIGHVGHLDPGHAPEQLAAQMGRRSGAGRRKRETILFGVGDEFLGRRDRHRVRHEHEKGEAADERDRSEVRNRVIAERPIKAAIDRLRKATHQHRVAVGIGLGRRSRMQCCRPRHPGFRSQPAGSRSSTALRRQCVRWRQSARPPRTGR